MPNPLKRPRTFRRSLTNRIRVLQLEQQELELYEALVTKSLEELGIDQSTFDERVRHHESGGLDALHRRFTSMSWASHERFELASTFAKLAIERIDPGTIAWEQRWARAFFLVAHDARWRRFVQLVVALYFALVFVEAERTYLPAASGLPGTRPWAWWVAVLEGACALTYMADICLHVGYQRRSAAVAQRQNYVRVLVALACFVDWVAAACIVLGTGGTVAYLRWSRPLRMLYLPFTDKASYNSVLSILDSLPSLADLATLAFVCTLIWAIVGVSIFEGLGLRAPAFAGDDSNAFDRFDLAFVALLTLMTGENYPNVMWPALNRHPASLAYFLAFVLVGTIMIMPTIVAIVFEFYKRFHGIKVLEEKMVERRCLLLSFALVDEDDSGAISYAEFGKLAESVQPQRSTLERSVLYKLLDSDGDNVLTAQEFIKLSDVLLLRVRPGSPHALLKRFPWLRAHAPALRRLVETSAFERVTLGSILLYVCVLALQAHREARAWAAPGTYDAIDVAFVAWFSVEMGLKMGAHSVHGFFSDLWNRMDCAIVLASIVTLVVSQALAAVAEGGQLAPGSARALRTLRVLRSIRAFSLFSHSHKLRVLTRTFLQMRPVIMTVLATILILFSAYLAVGLEAFHGRAQHDEGARAVCGAWCPGFDNALLGGVTLLQLVLAANWPELTDALDGGGPADRFLTWVYLVTFVLLTNAIVLSLLAALVLEIYSVEAERQSAGAGGGAGRRSLLSPLFEREALHRASGVGAESFVVQLSDGVRRLFERYDKDGSETVSAAELGSLLADLGERLAPHELEALLAQLDTDSDGLISFAEFLPWWQRHGLGKVFRRFDADGSGTIEAKELGALMAAVGSTLTEEELALALHELDADASGSIGFEEYASWFSDWEVRRVFNTFDSDGSGAISRFELAAVLTKLGVEVSRRRLREAFEQLDVDGDGAISFDDFLPWWKRLRSEPGGADASAHTFELAHDRTSKWEEQLFLRRRETDEFTKLAVTSSAKSMGSDGAARRAAERGEAGALERALRQIAADVAAGAAPAALTEEYLLSTYLPPPHVPSAGGLSSHSSACSSGRQEHAHRAPAEPTVPKTASEYALELGARLVADDDTASEPGVPSERGRARPGGRAAHGGGGSGGGGARPAPPPGGRPAWGTAEPSAPDVVGADARASGAPGAGRPPPARGTGALLGWLQRVPAALRRWTHRAVGVRRGSHDVEPMHQRVHPAASSGSIERINLGGDDDSAIHSGRRDGGSAGAAAEAAAAGADDSESGRMPGGSSDVEVVASPADSSDADARRPSLAGVEATVTPPTPSASHHHPGVYRGTGDAVSAGAADGAGD